MKLAIIDRVVRELHFEYIQSFNFDEIIEIDGNEKSKNFETIMYLYQEISNFQFNRNDYLYAIGGGVIGDMVGFVASTYKRGVNLVHIPTTLLAMVDSSIGGKTGFNLESGKNLVGTFYQAKDTIVNIDFLNTLDDRQIKTGMAEAIKYRFIDSKFTYIKDNLEELVYACVSSKKRFIEKDFKDFGERQFLNFGHSFGHALEKITNYEKYTHGEAITKGMYLSCLVGQKLGLTSLNTLNILKSDLEEIGLDYSLDFNIENLLETMIQDKKNDSPDITIILLLEIGKPLIHKISKSNLLEIFKKINE